MPRTAQDVRDNPLPGDWVGGHPVYSVDSEWVRQPGHVARRDLWRNYAVDTLINFVVPYHVGEVVRLGGPDGVDVVFDGMYDYADDMWADVRVGTALVRVALCDLTPLSAPTAG